MGQSSEHVQLIVLCNLFNMHGIIELARTLSTLLILLWVSGTLNFVARSGDFFVGVLYRVGSSSSEVSHRSGGLGTKFGMSSSRRKM